MADGRKNNGGHSTKSKKAIDRRKRMSLENPDNFDAFFDSIKNQLLLFYDEARKEFLDKYFRHGQYYVYIHKLNGVVVYIGKGSGERALKWYRTKPEHSELILNNSIEIEIVANNLTEENALLIEDALIKRLNPRFNTSGVEDGTFGLFDEFEHSK